MTPEQQSQWQHGFDLLCWSLREGPGTAEEFNRLTTPIRQWDGFINQLHWHRVAGLAWRRLAHFRNQLPEDVADVLQQARHQTASLAMKHGQELIHLSRQFNDNALPFVILKGLPQSLRLYQDAGRRFSRDIDILVPEARIEDAHDILTASHYVPAYPAITAPDLFIKRFRQQRKDCTYNNRQNGTVVELHWRLNNNPFFLPLEALHPLSAAKTVDLAGHALPVFQNECNALYLMLHATHSGWARLSWLTDIAELMRQPLDWMAVMTLARKLKVEPGVVVTLQLAHELLDAPLPPVKLADSWQARALLRQARITLRSARYPTPANMLLQRTLHCQRIDYFRFLLLRELGLSLNDMLLLPLPDKLFFLYYPLRPLLWAWRHTIGPLDLVSGRHRLKNAAP